VFILGDVDPSCSYVANQRCIDGLGAPVSEAWRPWKYTDPHVFDGPPATMESGGVQTGGWCEKRHFLRHLYIKCIILPRQARDKDRKS
jgi:hypothetical protein